MSNFFHLHSHTQFSQVDGMSKVALLVERAAQYKQPAFSTTDHGNMSATVQAYKECKKAGLKYFPGMEAYIADPRFDSSALDTEEFKKAGRYHLGLLALNLNGYKGLVKASTLSFTRPRYQYKPRLLVDDLLEFGQEYGDDIAITTGCVFGLVEKVLMDEGLDRAEGIIRTLQAVTPNLYVEVQRHGITEKQDAFSLSEDELIEAMTGIADKFSLPMVATADFHYLDQKQEDAHKLMKRMVYGDGDEAGDNEFPGDTFHLASTGWMKEKWSDDMWSRFEESYADLLDKNTLSIPQLDNYHPEVPEMSKTADADLRKQCYSSLYKYAKKNLDAYEERLDHELDVIQKVGMANYFLLVLQCLTYIRGRGVPVEARGSANGSLVCFLLNITQVDPLIWGTDFARFMAEDRIEAPDVDIDIADKDRHLILEYLNRLEINGVKYRTSQIGTYSQLGQSETEENDAGSAFNQYVGSLKRRHSEQAWAKEKKKAEAEGRAPNKAEANRQGAISWNMSEDKQITRLSQVKELHPEDYAGLKEIIAMKSVYKSVGTHAGGILVSGEGVKIEDFVPLMMIPSGGKDTVVTQYTMKDVEQLGLLKMDWLGQTSLTVMQKCMEFIGRENTLDFSWIPFDDKKTLEFAARRKNHPGLFHLENYPKSVAMAELKPKSTMDFVVWQAYSMPGAVDSGAKDKYLKRRQNPKIKDYEYEHELLHQVFDITNGVMLFQEQVLEVCRGVGMVGSELTSFFKVIKDSGAGAVERNRKRLEEMRPRFDALSEATGLSVSESEWVWEQMKAMGGYAFNRAHAAGYGIRSYRTCYLKYYYPTEYMAALLYCWAGSSTTKKMFGKEVKKEDVYLAEVKNMGIKVLPPRINISGANWKVEGKALRKGFRSCKGIGLAAAEPLEANQPYEDLRDLAERASVSGSKPYLKDLKAHEKDETKPIKPLIGVLKTLEDLRALQF
jgi:DNA polymerase-3 subunit alpha